MFPNGLNSDKNVIIELLENMTKLVYVGKIDAKTAKTSDFYFENSIKIFVSSEPVLDLSFSLPDASYSRCFIKNNKTGDIYVAEDSYSRYFELNATDFLNKNFFPEEFAQNKNLVSSITLSDKRGNSSRTLTAKSKDFDKTLSRLVSLRSSQIVDFSEWDSVLSLQSSYDVIFESVSGKKYPLSIYQQGSDNYCFAQGILYKISEWTLERIVE